MQFYRNIIFFLLACSCEAGPVIGLIANVLTRIGATGAATAVAGSSIAGAFGVGASAVWFGQFVVVNGALYYGSAVAGIGALAAGGAAAGAVVAAKANDDEVGDAVTDENLSRSIMASISAASTTITASEEDPELKPVARVTPSSLPLTPTTTYPTDNDPWTFTSGPGARKSSTALPTYDASEDPFRFLIDPGVKSRSQGTPVAPVSSAPPPAGQPVSNPTAPIPPVSLPPGQPVPTAAAPVSSVPPPPGQSVQTPAAGVSSNVPPPPGQPVQSLAGGVSSNAPPPPGQPVPTPPATMVSIPLPPGQPFSTLPLAERPKEVPDGVPEFNFRMCQYDIIRMGQNNETLLFDQPLAQSIRVDNVPATCMVLATVLIGDPEKGPHPVPMGSASLQWNDIAPDTINLIRQAFGQPPMT